MYWSMSRRDARLAGAFGVSTHPLRRSRDSRGLDPMVLAVVVFPILLFVSEMGFV